MIPGWTDRGWAAGRIVRRAGIGNGRQTGGSGAGDRGADRQTDRQGLGGRQGSQTGRNQQQAGSEKYEVSSRGKALRNSGDNLAGNDWEERTNIGSTQVEVVGLIREGQSGRQVNGKTRRGS